MPKEQPALNMSNQAALTSTQSSIYLGINSDGDPLKVARSTGLLWGAPAPKFRKVGPRKILYLKSDLDEFLGQFPAYQNNAEVPA